LHLTVGADGNLSGTLDSPNQGASGIACTDFQLQGSALSFKVPAVGGSWRGTIEDDGTLAGNWNQGSAMALTFSPEKSFVAAEKPSAVDGYWLGTVITPARQLRIQLSIRSDQAGQEYCSLDSLDQNAFGLTCTNVGLWAQTFSFDVPVVHGHWSGTLSEDGRTLTGTWTQGQSLPLSLQRQPAAIAPPQPLKVSYEPASAPLDAAALQVSLDQAMSAAVQSGVLAADKPIGIAVGIVRNGARRILCYGSARLNSIFEIGSITKTFTGLALAQLVTQQKVRLDEPVRELLPAGTVEKPEGAEITLRDLVTQHSGLPRLPGNLRPANPANPYADYHAAELYAYLRQQGVAKPADASFLYSNLGVGLLGQALANRFERPYADLVHDEILEPLDLHDTMVSLPPAQLARFIPGHTAGGQPAPAWDQDALAGAGALRSTASDMLTYLEANLHPDRAVRGVGPDAATLPNALVLSHQLQTSAGPAQIAFAWLYLPEDGDYWHNGGTGGYTAYAFFNPRGDYAAVVLMNVGPDPRGSFADLLGRHISQRFAGKPAISLSDVLSLLTPP
jgi:CubicO group peptidase (beta-lactamase class C family)